MAGLRDPLRPLVDGGQVPGLVALVARGSDAEVTVLGEQTVGGPPMREDSLFRVASVGKAITATVVLTLVADGLVSLDDPVADALPELAAPRVLRTPTAALDDTVPARRPITVGDLLRSTNGHGFPSSDSAIVAPLLERLHQGPPQPASVPPPDQWMAELGRIPLAHQPGDGFTYNTAYDILGVFVARVTGQPFARAVMERVLQPLGMRDTGFSFPPAATARATTWYRRGDDGALEVVDAPDGQFADPPAFASGAGGYVSTAADLLAFHRMLLVGGAPVLPPDLVAAMTRDQLTAAVRATGGGFLDGQSWGFGGGVDVARRNPWNVVGRYGWVGGTGTSAYVVPADASVAILLTQVELGGPDGGRVLETFWRAAAAHFGHDA
jgi:CubicO group peptidase (beta-lactamase class C family)